MAAEAYSVIQERYGDQLALVNQGVEEFAKQLASYTAGDDVFIQSSTDAFAVFADGGKRTRPMLTLAGYDLYGGEDFSVARRAGVVIEAMHDYLLIVDDIIDNAALRRGKPAVHTHIGRVMEAHNVENAAERGAYMANLAALTVQHLAQLELQQIDVPSDRIVRATALLNQQMILTGLGQMRDMSPTSIMDVTEEDITEIAAHKTGHYSIGLPCKFGALLAGAPADELPLFNLYARHVGIGFQLLDDVLGVFGDPVVTGKPQMSDIQEGKKTLLVKVALEKAGEKDRCTLLSALGNAALSEDQFADCQRILRQTKALDLCRARIAEHTVQAIAALDTAPAHWRPGPLQFLREFARQGERRQA